MEIEGEHNDRSIAVSLLSAILVGDPSFNTFKLFSDKNASIILVLSRLCRRHFPIGGYKAGPQGLVSSRYISDND